MTSGARLCTFEFGAGIYSDLRQLKLTISQFFIYKMEIIIIVSTS